MKNIIKNAFAGLIQQAQTAIAAIVAKAAAIGLVHSKSDAFTANVNNLIAASNAHDAAKTAWEGERTALKAAKKAARGFAGLSREVLKPYIGVIFNELVAGAGFKRTFAIPSNCAELAEMLRKIGTYLTNNPAHENEPLNITAARANALAADLTALTASTAAKKALVRQKTADRDTKRGLVRSDLQTLLGELHLLLPPLSAEWIEFGFNMPGILSVPAIPTNVSAVLIGPSAVAVKWDKAARATNYRIYKKVVGVDAEFVLVDTRSDLDYAIEGLPANAQIEIAVAATNNGGDSQMSVSVTVVTTA